MKLLWGDEEHPDWLLELSAMAEHHLTPRQSRYSSFTCKSDVSAWKHVFLIDMT